jgi:hypothetical protein
MEMVNDLNLIPISLCCQMLSTFCGCGHDYAQIFDYQIISPVVTLGSSSCDMSWKEEE